MLNLAAETQGALRHGHEVVFTENSVKVMEEAGKRLTYRESRTKVTFSLDQRAHLTLTVHRSARRELAALLERHDCADEGTEGLERFAA